MLMHVDQYILIYVLLLHVQQAPLTHICAHVIPEHLIYMDVRAFTLAACRPCQHGVRCKLTASTLRAPRQGTELRNDSLVMDVWLLTRRALCLTQFHALALEFIAKSGHRQLVSCRLLQYPDGLV